LQNGDSQNPYLIDISNFVQQIASYHHLSQSIRKNILKPAIIPLRLTNYVSAFSDVALVCITNYSNQYFYVEAAVGRTELQFLVVSGRDSVDVI
jgi:hypothetical protein